MNQISKEYRKRGPPDNREDPAGIQTFDLLCLARHGHAKFTTTAAAIGVQAFLSCAWDDRVLNDLVPMTLRNRFLITAAVLCHLLLVPPLVTSQLPPANSSSADASQQSSRKNRQLCNHALRPGVCRVSPTNHATICAIQQERDGDVYKLHGAVEIYYETYVLKADEATFNSDTNEATASGHFALDGGPNDDHIRADHGTYNFALETGKFYDVTGTTGLRFRANRVILTSTAPFAFTGKLVEKTSQDHYLVYDGTITTCELPHPNWQFDARKVSVDVGGNAKIYRSTFDLHGIPILCLPYATHPVEKESRQSGFLMPSVGHSSTNGYMVGDAYYWAINRMMDATIGAEYFSLRGWLAARRIPGPSQRNFLHRPQLFWRD